MFNGMDITYTGMSAMREWIETTNNNIANINTTRTSDGGPYKRQTVTFEQKDSFDSLFQKKIGGGVEIGHISQDNKTNPVYDPSHPDANAEGIVAYPAIDLAAEMTNLIAAQRGYEANVTTFNATKQVMNKQLEIGNV